ncbi:glycoside hydrolase family 92 protein [Mucilaginibacter sp. ZT4R22]|uniref:Glycoside hydrolase family 92 protein n=1 Tax=Mucilaginibacter pankratovii TaxID=2772110 RepID=A0ABR7WLK0_9SPHI|nr:GH92 family glycosyl hydrolase [Mucilaginibacter pankratovii]MBD1363209.1 glycoside hydrolase family 92 protein [Mucilaginibacter pankratovii]
MRGPLRKFVSIAALCLVATASVKSQPKPVYTKYVNTFIGTAPLNDPKILGYELPKGWRSWAGLTFPGSSLPNAMVQLSPVTEYGSGAGYQYEDSVILGFTHTNKGHWNLCNIPILPVSGGNGKFGSRFTHKKESSAPGFYQVYLDDYKVDVKLTSTLRSGYHQYTYQNNTNRQILFDLGKANSRVTTWNIKQVGDNAVQGFQGGENVYFYAVINTKIKSLDKTDEGKRTGNALITLANEGTGPVELKIGLSFVSAENAKQNLEKEIGNKSFETIRAEATQNWEKLLSFIQVKGGTAKQKTMFYSCLYRSFLWPALRSDVNGEFTDVKKNVVKTGFNYYTEPSLWDTYRNKDVLLGLISPQVTLDVIKSMKDVGDKTGFIPTFFHGDHGASSIAGAYLRGIDNFDIKGTYQILLRNANVSGGARPYIAEYIEKGYISDPDIANPNVETKAKAGVSKTLEYSYDDYSVAQIAKKLGDTANYRILMARSKNYKNMFDPSTRFMRGRLENGDWIKNFNPQYPYYEYMYREANAWQVSFFAPHDMPGLIKLYGGPKGFESKLDSLFTLPWNPSYIARNVETMIGQYCQGNQPDHEAPFAYIFINKPAKSQKILDHIMNDLYGIGKEGLELSGMDDAGEMSSWYVFSALGLYPFSATDPKYIVTAPLFDEVKWRTSNGKLLTITKPGKGRAITSVKVNGAKLNGYFVSHDLFKQGGKISIASK